MVAVVKHYSNALASGLIPLLSTLSAGTEMASYGNSQWEFLLRSNEVTTFVALEDNGLNVSDGQQSPILGCLLRVDIDHESGLQEQSPAAQASAGFGMMLVAKEARGKGVAKMLLHEAMSSANNVRNLLAVCTEKGQPVYRKIGYSDVGRVTALKNTVGGAKNSLDIRFETNGIWIQTYGSMDDESSQNDAIDPEILNLIASMDAKATGWNRKERLLHLLNGDRKPSPLRSMAAVATLEDKPVGAAVLRREGPGGPFVVGPVLGSESAALALVATLANSINGEHDNQTVTLLASDHPELVDRFRSAGFSVGFDFPAMSLDGRPIYEHGDGSYLGLIHPTLG